MAQATGNEAGYCALLAGVAKSNDVGMECEKTSGSAVPPCATKRCAVAIRLRRNSGLRLRGHCAVAHLCSARSSRRKCHARQSSDVCCKLLRSATISEAG